RGGLRDRWGRRGGRRRGGDLRDLLAEGGELLLLRVGGLPQRGDRFLLLLPLLVAERDERDGVGRRGVGARVLLDDLRQRLPGLIVVPGGHLFARLLEQRRGLPVVRHGEDEGDDGGEEKIRQEGGDEEESANAHAIKNDSRSGPREFPHQRHELRAAAVLDRHR